MSKLGLKILTIFYIRNSQCIYRYRNASITYKFRFLS